MLWQVIIAVIGVTLGIMSQIDVDDLELVLVNKTVALMAPKAKVFQFLAEMKTFSQWYPRVSKLEAVDVAPMSVGKHFFMVQYIPLMGDSRYTAMVTGYESPHYMSFVLDDWLLTRIELSLERRADSKKWPCALVLRIYSRHRTALYKYALYPLLSAVSANTARQALFNLKFIFES